MSLFDHDPPHRRFRRAWFGYNRADVEEHIERTGTELHQLKQQLQEQQMAANRVASGRDSMTVVAQRTQQIVEEAQQQAQALLAEAERQAMQITRQAAVKTERVQGSEDETTRRERERLERLRRDVTHCLEISDAALRISDSALRDAHKTMAGETETALLVAAESNQTPIGPSRVPSRSGRVSRDAGDHSLMMFQSEAAGEVVDATAADPPGSVSPLSPNRSVLGGLAALVIIGGLAALATTSGGPGTHPANSDLGIPQPAGSRSTAGSASAPAIPEATGPGNDQKDLLASETDGLVLTLTAQRDCWIRMLIDGGQEMERLMPANETIVLRARDQATLRVGDAGALSMLIGNRPAKPLGENGEVVNLRITTDNVARYLADSARAAGEPHVPSGR